VGDLDKLMSRVTSARQLRKKAPPSRWGGSRQATKIDEGNSLELFRPRLHVVATKSLSPPFPDDTAHAVDKEQVPNWLNVLFARPSPSMDGAAKHQVIRNLPAPLQ
jgi:hypothetical protein